MTPDPRTHHAPDVLPDCAHPADPELLNRLFIHGRTHSHWLPKPVDDAMLMRACDVRLPTRLTEAELDYIATAIIDAAASVQGAL